VALTAQSVELSNITVSAHAGEQYKRAGTDIAMRGVITRRKWLRIIPGIVIASIRAAAKPEQISYGVFDCDHAPISGWGRRAAIT